MLSICTPIFNVDVTSLVEKLINQAKRIDLSIEILAFDDGSKEHFKLKNRSIKNYPEVNYIELKYNMGSAAIRNMMVETASYNHLLFIDSDSDMFENFLKTYQPLLLTDYLIVCGGRIHPQKLPGSEFSLRWKVGKKREDFSASIRNKVPNKSFMSNNFLAKKELFNNVFFDRKIKRSGHEDTMMGIEMEEQNIFIHHIDNPVIHIGLENNQQFLHKTLQRVDTLHELTGSSSNIQLMHKRIKLLRYTGFIKTLKLEKVIAALFMASRNWIEKQLCSINPNLFLYDLYKIGYFSQRIANKS